jgi:predicted nucleic acid-binding protein
MAVIDTGVLITVLLEEESAPIAAAFLDEHAEHLHAPDVIHLEVANALVNAVRQKRLTAAEAEPLMVKATSIPIHLHPTVPLVTRAWRLSIDHARRPYDGVFVALAEQRKDVVFTLDRRLVTGLAGTPVARFVQLIA